MVEQILVGGLFQLSGANVLVLSNPTATNQSNVNLQ